MAHVVHLNKDNRGSYLTEGTPFNPSLIWNEIDFSDMQKIFSGKASLAIHVTDKTGQKKPHFIIFCPKVSEGKFTCEVYSPPNGVIVHHGDYSAESIPDQALKVVARNGDEGVAAEYAVMNWMFGKPKQEWELKKQSLMTIDGKKFDKMEIQREGEDFIRTLYFDISSFFSSNNVDSSNT